MSTGLVPSESVLKLNVDLMCMLRLEADTSAFNNLLIRTCNQKLTNLVEETPQKDSKTSRQSKNWNSSHKVCLTTLDHQAQLVNEKEMLQRTASGIMVQEDPRQV